MDTSVLNPFAPQLLGRHATHSGRVSARGTDRAARPRRGADSRRGHRRARLVESQRAEGDRQVAQG